LFFGHLSLAMLLRYSHPSNALVDDALAQVSDAMPATITTPLPHGAPDKLEKQH